VFTATRHVARTVAEREPPDPCTVVVSITDPDLPPARLADGWRAVHRAAFHDVVSRNDPTLVAITPTQAAAIVAFLEAWHHEPEEVELLVHCEAGLSRSAAVARFAAEWYDLPLPHEPDYPHCNIEVISQLRRACGWYERFTFANEVTQGTPDDGD